MTQPVLPDLQNATPALVLASASAARQALLRDAGLRVRILPVPVDEAAAKRAARTEGLDASATALRLAELKAAAAAASLPEASRADTLVLGADQMLECDGRWFDKPADLAEARRHLEALRGRTHVLHTAVACSRGGRMVWRHVETPRLTVRAVSDRFLDGFIALEGEALLGSVGAYRLEGPGLQLFDRVEGEHAAILGLPMLPLLAFLRREGVLLF
jgi:septum formation protein